MTSLSDVNTVPLADEECIPGAVDVELNVEWDGFLSVSFAEFVFDAEGVRVFWTSGGEFRVCLILSNPPARSTKEYATWLQMFWHDGLHQVMIREDDGGLLGCSQRMVPLGDATVDHIVGDAVTALQGLGIGRAPTPIEIDWNRCD